MDSTKEQLKKLKIKTDIQSYVTRIYQTDIRTVYLQTGEDRYIINSYEALKDRYKEIEIFSVFERNFTAG